VTLTWDAPDDDGEKPVLGYWILRGQSEAGIKAYKMLDDVTEYTDEGLTNGVTYYYSIVAFNVVGNSSRSDPISATPVGPPSEPLDLRLSPFDETIGVEWKPPRSDEGSPLVGYVLYRGLDISSMSEHLRFDRTTTSSIDVDLTNGVSYYYAVGAYNAIGHGPLSTIVSATPLGLPGVPVSLVIETGDGYVSLKWEPPSETGGAEIIRYQIFRGVTEDTLASFD
jgi:hypothetical protein